MYPSLLKIKGSEIPEREMCLTCWRLHPERQAFVPKQDWLGENWDSSLSWRQWKILMAKKVTGLPLFPCLSFFSAFPIIPDCPALFQKRVKYLTMFIKYMFSKKNIVHILSTNPFWGLYQSGSWWERDSTLQMATEKTWVMGLFTKCT